MTLIERLEALSGPFEGVHPICDGIHALLPEPKCVQPPDYLRSIDAAMMLVPEGMRWCIDTCDGNPRAFVEPRHPYDGQPYWGNSKTPAIALCIAALRARSADNG